MFLLVVKYLFITPEAVVSRAPMKDIPIGIINEEEEEGE